jgi:tetratricopeptide (TPR) repeat protein
VRPVDAIVRGHPLTGVKRELLRKGHCREILLGGLPAEDVARYLALRFPDAALPDELLPLLVERSDGSPFVVVALVDHLLEHGMLVRGDRGWEFRGGGERVRTAIPDGLRDIIEPRLERLTADERRVLEIACVIGPEFAAHAVAGAAPPGSELGDVEVVEQLCDLLARRQELLRMTGEGVSPDGTTSARYAFRHALYQQVLDQNLRPSQRRRLHQKIGEQLEASHAGRTEDVVSALAAHFEHSGDVERAVRYHGEAAAQARWRFSYQETRLHVEAGLRLMRERAETTEAMQRQAVMLDDLGWASVASRGWGDEGAARAFARMRELAERLDASEARFNAMEGELTVNTMRAEYAIARQRGEEMLLLAEQVGNRMAVAAALTSLGATVLQLGEIEAAAEIGERGLALADPREPTLYAISCCSLIACSAALRGLVDRARAMNRESVGLAAKGDMPLFRAYAAIFAAGVSKIMLDVATTRSLAEEAVGIARDLGFSVVADTATIYRAWCDVQDGRIDEGGDALRTAFDAYLASGQRIGISSYSLPVLEGYLAAGDVRRASELLDRMLAFIAETGERIVEPEIHRLKGECLLAGAATRGQRGDAIGCFERAIALAAGQKALLFELRAAISLFRVRPKATRERLARLVGRFAPEDDCIDLRAAAGLLGA